MAEIIKSSINNFSNNFISQKFKENNNDPFFYRNKIDTSSFRSLTKTEIESLVSNNNLAENWNLILVKDPFNAKFIKNSEFYGQVTIGKLSSSFLEYNDLKLPIGIYNSTIISCVIGNDVVIRNVSYLSHYIIEDECMLFNIHEMVTSDHAKFGNGILKEGEDESLRIWLEVCNENEGRKILPFDKMITADAYLWSKFRDDEKLMTKLKEITEKSYDNKRGYYGTVGSKSVIKNSRIIKDVNIGEYSYIKGTNKLKNLTVLSSKDEATQIGEGVELVNGIVGYGSKIFYGSKAVRFITGRNTQLKYGARLINSVLGDNSTVSCCELLNNLIFPFHEQHHNNSFLIATTTLGQTNIAAGATIGSNHNSRTPDGEIVAGRGFWPGLCTSFKHNSKFASFVLVAKGDYDTELNIEYPFSLVSIDKHDYTICITPAFWFMYNMYAITRNISKFTKRDKRVFKVQNIEIDYLAPDSISEILFIIDKITDLINKNAQKDNNQEIILFDDTQAKKSIVKIIKPVSALNTYKDMCIYFVVNNIINYYKLDNKSNLKKIIQDINELYNQKLYLTWHNLGGQLIPVDNINELINDINNNDLSDWDQIHDRYNKLWRVYPEQKLRFALYTLEKINKCNIKKMSENDWKDVFKKSIDIYNNIYKASFTSREKDYSDKFRKITFKNNKEMDSVIGKFEDNAFLKELKFNTYEHIKILTNLIS